MLRPPTPEMAPNFIESFKEKKLKKKFKAK